MADNIAVIGAGLAGCEATWQLACAGFAVTLYEMKPLRRTPAQVSDGFAELVCSNSLRSRNPENAVGLLKEEMAALSSLVIKAAYAAQVPAGDALAVDRERFSQGITEALREHPRITIRHEVVTSLPEKDITVVATGPLTDAALAQAIASSTGSEAMYFYDAIAPIIDADSIDRSVVFAASRYDKGESADYLNCPMNQEEYSSFLKALCEAECMPLHAFEEARYFQGCMPIEVIAQSGPDSLRFGPMKPVGLTDPKTGRWPYAAVQLRQEDVEAQAYNMVGFQTKMKYPEQNRVLRMIPGLQKAQFLRYGAIHRNTFLDSPRVLNERMALHTRPNIHFAGQITGVEGYVESAAHGLLTARLLASHLRGEALNPPPPTTALGALYRHVRGENRLPGRAHEPHNINWAMMPRPAPPPSGRKKWSKQELKRLRSETARADLIRWIAATAA